MDSQLLTLEQDISNYNKVKGLVVEQLHKEGYISEEEAVEFNDRCQVIIYKATWFEKWFGKHMKDGKKDGWYMKIVEMHDKETNIDDIIRRTAQGK